MTDLSEREILDLIAEGESERVEFKETLSSSSKKGIMGAICAFANDLPGHDEPGYVFVGIGDDGTPAGIEVSDEMLRTLADMRTSGHIIPVPSMSVERVDWDGQQVAIVTVLPSDSPPVRYDGSILIRTGSRRGLASAQDERILNEKRRSRDLRYELHPVSGARLDALSMGRFEEYQRQAFSEEVLESNNRTLEERLAAVKMIDSPDNTVPTVLGLLTIGKDPQSFLPGAYVQFLKFEGKEMTDAISDDLEIRGPIPAIIDQLDSKLHAHNRVAVGIGRSVEERSALYPMTALQELTRNAIMHRSYEDITPIRVYWFSDRIEIINSGGPPGEVIGHLGEPGSTGYRNPSLAAAMRDMRLVQRFGVGIQLAREALEKGGNPPLELHEDVSLVRATVYPNEAYREGVQGTYKYHFKLGNRIVYAGVTSDLKRREAEHQQQPDWANGHIVQVGNVTTHEAAMAWEAGERARGMPTGY